MPWKLIAIYYSLYYFLFYGDISNKYGKHGRYLPYFAHISPSQVGCIKMYITIANIFALLLLLATIQSTGFFLLKLKVKFPEWLFFNPCSISNIIFLIGHFVFKTTEIKMISYIAILPMFFFGTLGMFFLPWKGMNIIAQIGHLIMTGNIFLLVYGTMVQKNFMNPTLGLLLSIFIFSPFIAIQQKYVKEHPERFKEILFNS